MVFRLLQGLFGAALMPLSQAVMLDIYPLEQRGQAMAIWGMGAMVGADHRAGAGRLADRELQLALGVLHQPAGRHPGAAGGDGPSFPTTSRTRNAVRHHGFALLSLAVASLQLCLDRGQSKGWFDSTEIVDRGGRFRRGCS